VWEAEVANWTGLLTNPPPTKPLSEEWRSFSLFSRLRFRETPKNGASILPNAE
jgi:hypothetical protein